MKRSKLILVVSTFLILNPLVFFLFSKNLLFTIGINVAGTSLMVLILELSNSKILAAYTFNLIFAVSTIIHAEVLIDYAFSAFEAWLLRFTLRMLVIGKYSRIRNR